MKTFKAKIEQITVQNFQSLRERTEIPIRPLTFLYGPNSAGKSSIFDALVFIDSVLNNATIVDVSDFHRRWCHQTLHDQSVTTKNHETMSVELRFEAYDFFFDEADQNDQPSEIWGKDGIADLIGAKNTIIELKVLTIRNRELEIFVSINGLPLLRVRDVENEEDNESGFTNELEFFPSGFGKTFDRLASRHEIDSEIPRFCKSYCYLSYNPLVILNTHESNEFEKDLVTFANYIFRCLRCYTFTPTNVSSDRQTIKNNELTTLVTSENWPRSGLPNDYINAPKEAMGNLKNLSNRLINRLARSKLLESIGTKDNPFHSEQVHTFVNRCLSEQLFLDQGYQLVFDICKVLPDPSIVPSKEIPVAALVVCSLQDKSGRRLTFEDVGTGISCVLPALEALHSWQSFTQQPELHLHPALQSAFGDILVETSKMEENRHIIETHSEYIILRCLRRIRETTAKKHHEDSSLAISPHKVCVLYFDPQADGSTKVKRIRVSNQGDFIDRWPKGFFEERSKDLFDE